MTQNETPDPLTLLVNHENRLNLIEYEIGILQNRMPMNPWRRVIWWMVSLLTLAVPIIGGYAVFFVDDPWKTVIAAGAFGSLAGGAVTRFVTLASKGSRPHRSVLVEDHR